MPGTAAIVQANLSVTAPTGNGTLTAYPTGSTRPSTVNLAFSTGRPQAGLNTIRISSTGQFTLFNNSTTPVTATATVHGYYLTGNPSTAGAFQKVAPATLFTSTLTANTAPPKPSPAKPPCHRRASPPWRSSSAPARRPRPGT